MKRVIRSYIRCANELDVSSTQLLDMSDILDAIKQAKRIHKDHSIYVSEDAIRITSGDDDYCVFDRLDNILNHLNKENVSRKQLMDDPLYYLTNYSSDIAYVRHHRDVPEYKSTKAELNIKYFPNKYNSLDVSWMRPGLVFTRSKYPSIQFKFIRANPQDGESYVVYTKTKKSGEYSDKEFWAQAKSLAREYSKGEIKILGGYDEL